MVSEKKRQELKREQVLNLLRSKGETGATNAELSNISLRYGGHLGVLYRLGYKIRKEFLGEGLFRYALIEEPSRENRETKKAYDVLRDTLRDSHFDVERFDEILNTLGIAVRYKAGTYNN